MRGRGRQCAAVATVARRSVATDTRRYCHARPSFRWLACALRARAAVVPAGHGHPRLHRHVPGRRRRAPADAASRGDADAVRQAIEEGATLEARDGQGRTALLLATHGNNVEAARELIEAGADVNAKDAMQDSAYLYAGAGPG